MFLFYVNPILIAAAVIPAIVLLRFVYKEDRLDKESPGLLLSLMVFGILATFAAIVTEQIGEAIPRRSSAAELDRVQRTALLRCGRAFRGGVQIPAAEKAHLVVGRIQLPV